MGIHSPPTPPTQATGLFPAIDGSMSDWGDEMGVPKWFEADTSHGSTANVVHAWFSALA